MRVVLQRCKEASVTIAGELKSAIGEGMLILLGIEDADRADDIDWLCKKIVSLRIFDDANGVMNVPITEVAEGGILLVSQFTLMASTRKGNRPSYIRASKPDFAVPMYEKFITRLTEMFGKEVKTGVFGANMQVALVNDGPVTIVMDSHLRESF
ncbi:MAG: D-tyrosyl-tRNA(Tyr) deacylase [Bacteroidales bacterium]|nr:D-tyrosyl-tRNA(Tyr) deacylase [Bacteroidales bacterium]